MVRHPESVGRNRKIAERPGQGRRSMRRDRHDGMISRRAGPVAIGKIAAPRRMARDSEDPTGKL
jgi:hypothetical protein